MAMILFDKKVKCGPEFVALRMIDKCNDLKIGDIYVPLTSMTNERLGFYVIEDIGSKASEELGLLIGNYVLADRLASFAHTEPIAVMKYNNIICLTNSDKSDFWPLRNTVFVLHDKHEDFTEVGGVYVAKYDGKLNTGTIVKINVDESKKLPFAVGDKVMLVKGGDFILLGTSMFTIYKPEDLICKFL